VSYLGPCTFCDEYVAERDAAYPIRGWEVVRRGGGANRILGRERVEGQVAHRWCAEREVQRRQAGIADGQGALL
jgi:hypothetical protein